MNNNKKKPIRPLKTIAEWTLTLAGYTTAFRKYSAKLEKKSQGREAGKISECVYRLL